MGYGKSEVIPNNYRCYLRTTKWRILPNLLIALCLISHYLAIFYSFYKMRKSQYSQILQQYYKNIIKKYLRFIVMYSIIWSIPIIISTQEWIFDNTVHKIPYGWTLISLICISSTGIGNGIIWMCNSDTVQLGFGFLGLNNPTTQATTTWTTTT